MLYGLWEKLLKNEKNKSLNPYFFGKCSTARAIFSKQFKKKVVLILIFLENALRPSQRWRHVSRVESCLNPYFFGKCSTASKEKQKNVKPIKVLILIFLENALRPR